MRRAWSVPRLGFKVVAFLWFLSRSLSSPKSLCLCSRQKAARKDPFLHFCTPLARVPAQLGPRHAPARKSRSMSMPDDAVQRMFERCWRTWSGAVGCC